MNEDGIISLEKELKRERKRLDRIAKSFITVMENLKMAKLHVEEALKAHEQCLGQIQHLEWKIACEKRIHQ